jgi:hypothetical protein
MADPVRQTIKGDGYAVTHLDAIGEGPGFRNIGDENAVYICAGGADGYVGRDGKLPDSS